MFDPRADEWLREVSVLAGQAKGSADPFVVLRVRRCDQARLGRMSNVASAPAPRMRRFVRSLFALSSKYEDSCEFAVINI